MKTSAAFPRKAVGLVWTTFGAVLVACLAAETWVSHKDYFGIAGFPAFYAWFGFFACVALVVFAKAVGVILKRRDTYYDA